MALAVSSTGLLRSGLLVYKVVGGLFTMFIPLPILGLAAWFPRDSL